MSAKTQELRRLALIGAEGRIAVLQGEIDGLVGLFPELRNGQPIARKTKTPAVAKAVKKPRRVHSAAAKKAISIRMKKYWAGRRKEKAAAPAKVKRGFGGMPPSKRTEIASLGGRAAHEKGTAHQWTSEEAAAAGREGGTISRGGRGRLPARSNGIPPHWRQGDKPAEARG